MKSIDYRGFMISEAPYVATGNRQVNIATNDTGLHNRFIGGASVVDVGPTLEAAFDAAKRRIDGWLGAVPPTP